MLNISRKLIFSKIFTNIINPFDSLEKKVKNKHLGDRKISIFARKKNIKNMYIIQFLQNIITISKFSIIVKFIESLSLFNLNKINKFKHLSSKQGDNFNFKNKEIVLKNQFFYFSKFVYMNMINKYLNFYLYNIYRIKKYISNYKYKNRGEKIIYKNKLDNSNNNKPFNDKKIFKPELYYSKNFDFLNYINYFKPTFLYNIKNNFSPLAKANNYLNEFKFNKFIVTLHEFMGLNSKNKGLDIKFNSSNLLEDRISVLARKNKLNSLYKKLKYNVIHKFNSYVFKINKLNLKKYNFIFKFFNLENKILPSYYFKQLNKRPNFVSVKKKVQSI